MRYRTKTDGFKVMKIEDCHKTSIPKSYFYISGDISRKALTKLHKLVKTKKFKKKLSKKKARL